MNLSAQMAKHFREVFFGGNWTSVNLKETLEGVSWQQAVTSVYGLNSIAVLVYHINYYVSAVLKVFEGGTLEASDKYSFDLTPIKTEEEWKALQEKVFADAEQFACYVEQMPEEKFIQVFEDEKYGTYYRNIHGIIEHTHYHLGQITLIKKIVFIGKVT
jgi:uncharacterized damage-inducible protein DinB